MFLHGTWGTGAAPVLLSIEESQKLIPTLSPFTAEYNSALGDISYIITPGVPKPGFVRTIEQPWAFPRAHYAPIIADHVRRHTGDDSHRRAEEIVRINHEYAGLSYYVCIDGRDENGDFDPPLLSAQDCTQFVEDITTSILLGQPIHMLRFRKDGQFIVADEITMNSIEIYGKLWAHVFTFMGYRDNGISRMTYICCNHNQYTCHYTIYALEWAKGHWTRNELDKRFRNALNADKDATLYMYSTSTNIVPRIHDIHLNMMDFILTPEQIATYAYGPPSEDNLRYD